MNAGDFGDRLEILELEETAPGTWEWVWQQTVWAKAEQQAFRSLISNNSITQRTTRFTVHANLSLTMHNALTFATGGGGHFHISDINRDKPGFHVLTAAFVEPQRCECRRTETGLGALNRPDVVELDSLVFPGILAEKYLRQNQGEPMSQSEYRFILIAPKCISLDIGELVDVGGRVCQVSVAHLLDPYKSEYEVVERSDN